MTAKALYLAAVKKKAITGMNGMSGRIPAGFVIGMPFNYVYQRLPLMKIYRPKYSKPNK